MRKFFTENRVLAFIQIALAFGAGSIVIAVTHSLSSLPWLYLAAIFFFVAAATAGGTYRLLAPTEGLDSQTKTPPMAEVARSKPSRPTVLQELTELLRRGDEISRAIEWQRMGKSLRLNGWRMEVNSILYSRAPEYREEMDAIAQLEDDLEMYQEIKKLLHRVMKDPNHR